jgi:hypothetical protein
VRAFPEITEAQRLTLKPGDVLVLHVKGRLSDEQVAMIRSRLLHFLPDGVQAMVLDQGTSLEVVETS